MGGRDCIDGGARNPDDGWIGPNAFKVPTSSIDDNIMVFLASITFFFRINERRCVFAFRLFDLNVLGTWRCCKADLNVPKLERSLSQARGWSNQQNRCSKMEVGHPKMANSISQFIGIFHRHGHDREPKIFWGWSCEMLSKV